MSPGWHYRSADAIATRGRREISGRASWSSYFVIFGADPFAPAASLTHSPLGRKRGPVLDIRPDAPKNSSRWLAGDAWLRDNPGSAIAVCLGRSSTWPGAWLTSEDSRGERW